MTIYAVDARRIDDRPDPQGWYSSGIDLPTFYVDAADPARALAAVHDIAGEGRTDVTRTLVWLIAYNPATDGRYGEVHHSVRTWNGWHLADQTEGEHRVHRVDPD